jgi:hypothetical protein
MAAAEADCCAATCSETEKSIPTDMVAMPKVQCLSFIVAFPWIKYTQNPYPPLRMSE